jgi:hypothetical protein
MPKPDTKAKIIYILNEALYWIAMGALVAAMCGQVRKHSQPLMLPTLDNIEAMEQMMQHQQQNTDIASED